jgi:hypothetical protein
LARLEEFSTTIFRPDRLARQVDELAAVIRPMVKEESAEKLARFEQAVAGKTLEQGGPGRPFGFAQPTKPIKPFVSIRTQSILDQLSHKAEGLELGFGGPAGRGDGGRPGGFRGPELTPARAILTALDGDKNGRLTREEFVVGFEKWFEAWNTDKNGLLTEDQLRAGMDKDFASPPAGLRGSPVPSGR